MIDYIMNYLSLTYIYLIGFFVVPPIIILINILIPDSIIKNVENHTDIWMICVFISFCWPFAVIFTFWSLLDYYYFKFKNK